MPFQLPKTRIQPFSSSVLADFTGGLDYTRVGELADPKFASDALNVDFLHDGGVGSRLGVKFFNVEDLSSAPKTLGFFERADGSKFVMVGCADGSVRAITGDQLASYQVVAAASGGVRRGVQANDKWYMFAENANVAPQVWDGSTLLSLKQEWNNNYATPTEGNMPMARLAAVFNGRMFLADTFESGLRYRNRVRFSHAIVNFKGEQSWRSQDYFELDAGSDGGTITGMTASGLSLFMTKEHAIYQITGFDSESVSVHSVAKGVGAVSPGAISALDGVLYVWDSSNGLYAVTRAPIGGDNPIYDVAPLGSRLTPLLASGKIPGERMAEVTVSAHTGPYGPEVWCAVPWHEGGKRVFKLDLLTKAWTQYDLNLGEFLHYQPRLDPSLVLSTTSKRVVKINEPESYPYNSDDFGLGPTGFPSYMTTSHLHDGKPFVNKRVVLWSGVMSGSGAVNLEVGRDWQNGNVISSYPLSVAPSGGGPFKLNASSLANAPQEQLFEGAPLTPEPCAEAAGDSLEAGRQRAQVDVRLSPARSQSIQFTLRGQPGLSWACHLMGFKYYEETRAL